MNIKAIAAVAALSASLISGAAGAQTINAGASTALRVQQNLRGEHGSHRNISRVRREVERSIDQLQRDNHDFGGHRVQAIELLQQARNQLLLAEQYDNQHPGH